MQRLASLDVTSGCRTPFSRLATQIVFGTGCAALFMLMRLAVDSFAPGVGPFALLYPPILIATLFGHWRAGVVAFAILFLWIWYAVLPPTPGWVVTDISELLRLVLNTFSSGLVIFFAEVFRRAVRSAALERNRQIEASDMLRRELEHRTKNNFQLMQSLLAMQRREETDEAAKEALTLAATRLSAFTATYACLPVAPTTGEVVPMQPYLEELVREVAKAVFTDRIAVSTLVAPIDLPRETAMAIGLYTNEALTNCAKHGFREGRSGNVVISLDADQSHWCLEIEDNGAGKAKTPRADGSGSALMQAFAKQARAEHRTQLTANGCTLRLRGVF